MGGILYLLFLYGILGSLLAFPAFGISRWCLRRRQRGLWTALLAAAAAACALGTAYGLLRLTGMVRFSWDNTYSFNFFDASWRDEGVSLLLAFASPLAGIGAAFRSVRKASD